MMASTDWNCMTADRQLFRRSIAEAVASLLGRKYPTAKQMARGVGIDTATAENVRKLNLSVTTLASILLAEGRGFYQALGDEIYGQPFVEYEEARLNKLIQEANHARENIRSLAARRQALEARADRAVADLDRPSPVEVRGAEGRTWPAAAERRSKPSRASKEG